MYTNMYFNILEVSNLQADFHNGKDFESSQNEWILGFLMFYQKVYRQQK